MHNINNVDSTKAHTSFRTWTSKSLFVSAAAEDEYPLPTKLITKFVPFICSSVGPSCEKLVETKLGNKYREGIKIVL